MFSGSRHTVEQVFVQCLVIMIIMQHINMQKQTRKHIKNEYMPYIVYCNEFCRVVAC